MPLDTTTVIPTLESAPDFEAEAILCDLDGCLISGPRVLPGAAAFAAEHGERLWVVSNNSTDTADSLARRLAGLGLPIAPERLVLAGEQTIRHLARQHPGGAVAFYGAEALDSLARELGLLLDKVRPVAAVLARDLRFTLEDLTRLIAQLRGGAALHVTNIDASHPGPDGLPCPETGALLAALDTCLPGIAYTTLGKPEPALLEIALQRAGVSPENAVLVGDNRATDGLAARAAGVAFVHVDGAGAVGGAAPC